MESTGLSMQIKLVELYPEYVSRDHRQRVSSRQAESTDIIIEQL